MQILRTPPRCLQVLSRFHGVCFTQYAIDRFRQLLKNKRDLRYDTSIEQGAVLSQAIMLTILFEVVTIIARFGFKLQSNVHTRSMAKWTRNIRIHHGYAGAALLPIGFLSEHALAPQLISIGFALLCSDLIHHFLVLLPVTGNHEFNIKYPPSAIDDMMKYEELGQELVVRG